MSIFLLFKGIFIMKNILVLSCSPRKQGNSDILCDQFMHGAEESGHQVEKIRIAEKKIGFCVGCEQCQQNGGVCVQKDDMAEILEKMIRADIIVMASPVYFYTINAQAKTLIDRTFARYTAIRDKRFYFIVTSADSEESMMERTVECFRGFLDCLEGAVVGGVVYGVGAWKKGDIKSLGSMVHAFEFGKNA